jgi:hypothetical protein
MTCPLEYHVPVKRSVQRPFPATLALFGTLLLPLLVSVSQAQSSNGSSSNSGHASTSGIAAPSHYGNTSVNSGVTSSPKPPHSPNTPSHASPPPQPRASTGQLYYPYVYAVPYAVDVSDTTTSSDDNDDAEYQGGPTVFDRRGSGPDSYAPPVSASQTEATEAEDPPASGAVSADSSPETPSDPTILVFKDGHQLEIENYAIVSETLYNLTPGHPRKIALADLDLPSTQKQNDDRGITFQLPSSAQGN